jgi:putative SOS response-associated peptidase YedK
MCGRYHITRLEEEITRLLGVSISEIYFIERYNAAPSQMLPVVASNNPKQIQFFKWGLIPHWAKDESTGNKMINARLETLNEKPTFKNLVNKNRCIVLTDGYYEWQKLDDSSKQPIRICLKDESVFAYAGLWSEWKNSDGSVIPTFTIITTEAYNTITQIHHRMPVMLNPEISVRWIKNEIEIEQLQNVMLFSNEIKFYPVSKEVNNPKNNFRELLDKL